MAIINIIFNIIIIIIFIIIIIIIIIIIPKKPYTNEIWDKIKPKGMNVWINV